MRPKTWHTYVDYIPLISASKVYAGNGRTRWYAGGLYMVFFFPLCKLFFPLLTRNKLFFLSGEGGGVNKQISTHPPYISQFSDTFVNKSFTFHSLLNKYVYHFLLNNPFFKKKKTHSPPSPHTYHLVGPKAPPRGLLWIWSDQKKSNFLYCKSPYIRCRKISRFLSFTLFVVGTFCGF